MAGYRRERLESSIRAIVSEAIIRELNDPRIAPLTSVTRVELSADYQFARIFVSVMGSDVQERTTLAGLQHAQGHLQRILAKALDIRSCPRIAFFTDAAQKTAMKTLKVIREVRQEQSEGERDESGEAPPMGV